MADKFDDNLFEDVEYTPEAEMDDSLFEDDTLEAAPEQPSTAEAVARGAGQGLTFGFLDELVAGLKASGGASPRQIVEDPKAAIEKERELFRSYEEELEKERAASKAAKEASPITYTASEVAGGVVPALLTGGASLIGRGSTVLTREAGEEALKRLAVEGAELGAKQGAVSGAGYSEGETPLEVAYDASQAGLIGAGAGAIAPVAFDRVAKAVPSAVETAKKAVQEFVPGAEAVQVGYEAGKKGIKASTEGIRQAVKDYSETLHKKVLGKLTKEGVDKKRAIEIADEMGIRINAGEAIDDIMEELADKGGIGLKDLKEKTAFYNVLDDLKTGNDATVKAIKKLETKAAKQAAKEQVKGGEVLTTSEREVPIGDLLPLPSQEGSIAGLTTKFKRKSPKGKVTTYIKDNVQEILEGPISLKQLNIKELKPSEAEDIIQYLNSYTGDLTKAPQNITERNARRLAANIRELSNEALEASPVSDKNAQLSNLLKGLRRLGIKDRVGGSEEATINQIDAIRKKLSATGEGAQIDRDRVFELLGRVDDLGQTVDEGKFIDKLSQLSGQTEGVRTTSVRGLLGTAEGVAAKVANVGGRTVKAISDYAAPQKGQLTSAVNKVSDLSDDALMSVSRSLQESGNSGLEAMGRQLNAALQQEGPIKNAMVWSLSQNPAFRKKIQKYIPELDKSVSEATGLVPEDNILNRALTPREELTSQEQQVEEGGDISREPAASDFLREKEDTRNVGYVPTNASGVTIATGLDLGNFELNRLNLPKELVDKLQPYVGLEGAEAKRVASNLKLTDEEVKQIDDAMEVYNEDKVGKLTEGIDPSLLTEEFDDGLSSFFTNTQSGARKFVERVKEGNVDEAIDKAVEWNKSGGKFASGLLQRRMEELYKMFPDKADLIQSEGKKEFDKYNSQTNRTWDDINTIEEKVEEAKKALDAQVRQQASGDDTPVYAIDRSLATIEDAVADEVLREALQDEAVNMETYQDAERLKSLLDGLKN